MNQSELSKRNNRGWHFNDILLPHLPLSRVKLQNFTQFGLVTDLVSFSEKRKLYFQY